MNSIKGLHWGMQSMYYSQLNIMPMINELYYLHLWKYLVVKYIKIIYSITNAEGTYLAQHTLEKNTSFDFYIFWLLSCYNTKEYNKIYHRYTWESSSQKKILKRNRLYSLTSDFSIFCFHFCLPFVTKKTTSRIFLSIPFILKKNSHRKTNWSLQWLCYIFLNTSLDINSNKNIKIDYNCQFKLRLISFCF